MIRTFVVVGAMLAAGPVWAEMAKAPAKPKPPKRSRSAVAHRRVMPVALC